MSTFTDAAYNSTKMGSPAPLNYSLSATNNYFTIVSAGAFNGADVTGVLYNAADFSTAVALASTVTVTLSSPGEATTVINLLSAAPAGVTLGLINVNRFSTTFTALSTSTTVITRVSAGGFDNRGPNEVRLWNLNS